MDPITQGALGASAAQLFRRRGVLVSAWFFGMLGGLLPDIDVLIRSSTDPFIALRFHRHFTHSLLTIPLGGLVVASLWIFRKKFRDKGLYIYLASTVGFATHALLDTFTSYGTMLLWPVSNERFAWDTISIIDPLFTFPLLAFVIIAQRMKKRRIALYGLLYCALYLLLCHFQHMAAFDVQKKIADSRGHTIEKRRVHAALATNVIWRSLYQHGGMIYSDAIRVPWWGQPSYVEGESARIFSGFKEADKVKDKKKYQKDIDFFLYFTDGWAGYDMQKLKEGEEFVGDMRYSREAQKMQPIWGIYLDAENEMQALQFQRQNMADREAAGQVFSDLWKTIKGTYAGLKPIK